MQIAEGVFGIIVAAIALYGLVVAYSKYAQPNAPPFSFGELLWALQGPFHLLCAVLLSVLPVNSRYSFFMLLVIVQYGLVCVGVVCFSASVVFRLLGDRVRWSTMAGFASVALTSVYLLYMVFKDGPVVI